MLGFLDFFSKPVLTPNPSPDLVAQTIYSNSSRSLPARSIAIPLQYTGTDRRFHRCPSISCYLHQCGPLLRPHLRYSSQTRDDSPAKHAGACISHNPLYPCLHVNISQRVAFSAAIVLLLNTWSGKRSGFAYNPSKELEHVSICLKLITAAEKR